MPSIPPGQLGHADHSSTAIQQRFDRQRNGSRQYADDACLEVICEACGDDRNTPWAEVASPALRELRHGYSEREDAIRALNRHIGLAGADDEDDW